MIGAVLAGGAGRRMGGDKQLRELAGRPLVAYPVSALGEVCHRVAVVAKRDTPLPELERAERWDEPDEPRHPLTGIVAALERAREPVLVCAADMPFVGAAALRPLLDASGPAIAVSDGILQPLLGVYTPAALDALHVAPDDAPLTRTIEALDPRLVHLPASVTRSVDTPAELAAAERELAAQKHEHQRERERDLADAERHAEVRGAGELGHTDAGAERARHHQDL